MSDMKKPPAAYSRRITIIYENGEISIHAAKSRAVRFFGFLLKKKNQFIYRKKNTVIDLIK
jgi:hypothetical protein